MKESAENSPGAMSKAAQNPIEMKHSLHVPIVQKEHPNAVFLDLPPERGELPLPPDSLLQYAHAGETPQSHAKSGENDFQEISRIFLQHRPDFFSERR